MSSENQNPVSSNVCEGTEPTEEEKPIPTFVPRDHQVHFDPRAYLTDFYASHNEDLAMQVILFFMPGFVYRIPEGGTLLDLGSGPTIHCALCFRNRVDRIYLSDFAAQNRRELKLWWKNEPDSFDWSPIVDRISLLEGNICNTKTMERDTREKICGILSCDVHLDDVFFLPENEPESLIDPPKQFDIITTIFCLEYASETYEEYRGAVKNAVNLLKPGGYLLMGGVLEADSYTSGGTRFLCHYLTQSQLIDALSEAGIVMGGVGPYNKFIVQDGVFLLVGRKKQ